MKRKLLSVLLVLAMALTLLPTAAFATGTVVDDSKVTVTTDAATNPSLWGEAVTVDTTTAGTITINVDLAKLNAKKDAFAEKLVSNNGYFRFNSGNTIDATTNGAQLCLPISIELNDNNVTPTEVTCKRMNGTTNMDEGNTATNSTSMSATYSDDKTTVHEWPVVAFTGLTYASETQKVSYTDSATPFAFNDKGATGELDTWTYAITWTDANSNTYTKDVVINITKIPEPVATPIQVVPANLTAVDGAQAPAYGHATSYTAELTDKVIAVTAEGLEKTKNTQNVTDYWVGVGLTKQEGATYAWGFGTKPDSPEYKAVDRTQTTGEKTYTTLYWSSDDTNNAWSETTGYISVKVNDVVTDYTVSFNVNVKTDTPVNPPAGTLNFSTLLATEVTEGKIYGKAPETLGKFTVEQGTGADVTKITVTGTANYITGWTEFNGDSTANENNGHYLPIQIKGEEGQKITIKGANEKTLTFGEDGSFELVMFLDKLTNSTFTVTVVNEDVTKAANTSYTIDCTGVVLLPNTEGSTPTETKVTVSEKEVESLGNLIKDDNVTTEANPNAPVTVETVDDSKTLTFTGKDGTEGSQKANTTVTLPATLVEAVGGTSAADDGTQADVKVESSSGSVTIPSATLATNDTKAHGVTLVVKKAEVEKAKLATAADDTVVLADADKEALVAATGVTVTAKTNSTNIVNDATAKVTVVIAKLTAGTPYTVFCVKEDGTVTKVGEITPTGTTITVKSSHLTSFVAIPTASVSENLAKVKADTGATIPVAPSTTSAKYTRNTTDAFGKVEIVNGTASKYYIFQAASGANALPAMIYCVQADGTGKAKVYCNKAAVVHVWESDTVPTFTNGVPAGLTPVEKQA